MIHRTSVPNTEVHDVRTRFTSAAPSRRTSGRGAPRPDPKDLAGVAAPWQRSATRPDFLAVRSVQARGPGGVGEGPPSLLDERSRRCAVTSQARTGFDLQVACVLAAINGDWESAAAVRRMRQAVGLAEASSARPARRSGCGPRLGRDPTKTRRSSAAQPPRLPATADLQHVLEACVRYGASFPDDSVAVGAIVQCASINGLSGVQAALAKRLLRVARTRRKER